MPYRVVMFGLGRVGGGVARLIAASDRFEIVGAVCRRPQNDGRDVGEIVGVGPLGVLASTDADEVLGSVDADIAVHATHPRLAVVEPELAAIVDAGLNVITTTEEAAFPWGSHPEEAGRLDEQAKSRGVSILATGVSPGFIWDSLVSVFALGSSGISAIKLRRRTTMSYLSDGTLGQMGVGLTASEFEEAVQAGDVFGHVGSRQSLDMVGTALGWKPVSFEETLVGVVGYEGDADEDVRPVDPERVCGFDQTAHGVFDRGAIEVTLAARLGIRDTYDEIELVGPNPRLLRITPAVEAMVTTHAMVANVLPAVVGAQPGLRTMLDLPLAGARLGDSARTPSIQGWKGVVE